MAIVTSGRRVCATPINRSVSGTIPRTVTIARAVVLNASIRVFEIRVPLVFMSVHVTVMTPGFFVNAARVNGVFPGTIPTSVTITRACVLDTSVHVLELGIPLVFGAVYVTEETSRGDIRVADIFRAFFRAIPPSVTFTETVILVALFCKFEWGSTLPSLKTIPKQ